MNNNNPKISNLELRGLMVSNVIGVGVLSLPNSLANLLGNDGWIPIIITAILIMGLYLVYCQIFLLNPGKDFFQIGKENLGFFFYLTLVIFIVYLVLLLGIVSRNLGELIKIFLLQTTPLQVIIITFILVSTYLASYEIDSIARAGYFIYPIIIVFAVLVVLISLPKADFTHLLPVFQTDLISIAKGVKESLFSFYGIEIVVFAIPFIDETDKGKIKKSGIYGIITIAMIYTALYLMTLTHFSIDQIKDVNYPILVLVRQLDLPGFFLENLDGLVIALWVLVVFATFVPAYYSVGKILSKMFKTKKHKYFILALVPIIFMVAILPKNFVELLTTMQMYFNIVSSITVIILPLILLITIYIRKKGTE